MIKQVLRKMVTMWIFDVEMVDQATNGLYYQALTAQMNGRLKMLNYVTTH